jgi:hypothetical protein
MIHFDEIILHSIPQHVYAYGKGFDDEFGFLTFIHSINPQPEKQDITITKSLHYFFSLTYLLLLRKSEIFLEKL